MRRRLIERVGRWANLLVTFALVLTLGLLSWGISASNLWASMLAGAMLAAVIVLGGTVVLVPDNLRSQAAERTMRVASSTLEHMRGGLTTENCNAVCQLVLPETTAQAVAITDTQVVLAYVGEQAPTFPPARPIPTPPLRSCGRDAWRPLPPAAFRA